MIHSIVFCTNKSLQPNNAAIVRILLGNGQNLINYFALEGYRQDDGKGASPAGGTLNRDPAMVRQDDMLGDRQS